MPALLSRSGCKSFYKLVKYYPNRSDYVQNRLLYTVKRHRAPRIHAFLARQLAPSIEQIIQTQKERPMLITYLPRDPRTVRNHGTDQAKMLAEALSKKTAIPVKPLLARTRVGGLVQKKLSRTERMNNAQKLFTLAEDVDLKGTTVILVDDLVTTGASMTAGIRLLRQAGATHFYCVAIANDA
jgi:ComF family protein